MIANPRYYIESRPLRQRISVAAGADVYAERIGSVNFMPDGSSSPLLLENVLCVPKLSNNLFSVLSFTASTKTTVTISGKSFTIKNNYGTPLLIAIRSERLAYFEGLAILAKRERALAAKVPISSTVLHRRLGHASWPRI